ncbi:DMT family transporter [Novosphingobium sp.]|uniref:DMT family transporter n=1 Tax=Novosphingobium sp. TaxID=1874826 RepID=UPI001DDBF63B|nr:DMT family transporter [Novosphingobium sp.]MBX9662786.1 DMT family transporter [Novosphingobium sp.]
MKRAVPLLPILSAMTGLLCFGVMDGFMKIAALAVGAYAALFWRNLVGSLIMLPVWLARGNKDGSRSLPGREAMRLHVLRAGVSGVMATLFFYGLARTPVAEAMALSFIAPLLALFLAAVWLGEELSRRAVAGSVLALSGVGLIAAGKFGGNYNSESVHGLIAILISAVLYAWNLVLQRRQSQLAGPEEISFFQTFFIFCLLGIGAWWFAPVPPAEIWAVLAASAVLSTASLMLLGWAYARAEAQVLVPLEYTAFIWAALVGWVVFAEPLTWRTLAGVVLIVAGCLIALQRKSAPEAAAERA